MIHITTAVIPVNNTATSTGTTTATNENGVSTTVVVGITDGFGDTVAACDVNKRVNSTSSCHTPMKKRESCKILLFKKINYLAMQVNTLKN